MLKKVQNVIKISECYKVRTYLAQEREEILISQINHPSQRRAKKASLVSL
jgi:hypothetical protein